MSERLLRIVHCIWGLLYYGFLLEVFVLVLGFIVGLLGVVGTVVYQGLTILWITMRYVLNFDV